MGVDCLYKAGRKDQICLCESVLGWRAAQREGAGLLREVDT